MFVVLLLLLTLGPQEWCEEWERLVRRISVLVARNADRGHFVGKKYSRCCTVWGGNTVDDGFELCLFIKVHQRSAAFIS